MTDAPKEQHELYRLLGKIDAGLTGLNKRMDTLSQDTHKRVDRLEQDLKSQIDEHKADSRKKDDAHDADLKRLQGVITDNAATHTADIADIHKKLARWGGYGAALGMAVAHGYKLLPFFAGG